MAGQLLSYTRNPHSTLLTCRMGVILFHSKVYLKLGMASGFYNLTIIDIECYKDRFTLDTSAKGAGGVSRRSRPIRRMGQMWHLGFRRWQISLPKATRRAWYSLK